MQEASEIKNRERRNAITHFEVTYTSMSTRFMYYICASDGDGRRYTRIILFAKPA